MKVAQSKTALRVQALLGPRFEVREFEASTRTAEDAAAAIGCTAAQIAKSLLFRIRGADQSALVVASGVNRVDEKKVAAVVGRAVSRADPEFVRERTGFSIGGVPPVGHRHEPVVVLDEDLRAHRVIWAAAGTPNAVFELSPDALSELTGALYHDIAKR